MPPACARRTLPKTSMLVIIVRGVNIDKSSLAFSRNNDPQKLLPKTINVDFLNAAIGCIHFVVPLTFLSCYRLLLLRSKSDAPKKLPIAIDSMRCSFLLLQDAPCTPLSSGPGIGQLGQLKSISSCLVITPRQVFNSRTGKVFSSVRGKRAFRGGSTETCSNQSPRIYGSPPRSRGVFFSGTQLLFCKVGTPDGSHRRVRICTKAATKGREWQEYEKALQEKDLTGALEALDVLNTFESDAVMLPTSESGSTSAPPDSVDGNLSRVVIDRPQTIDDLTILDACERTSDLLQVGNVYDWLKSRGVVPSFGKCKASSASEGDRFVTEADLLRSIGLTASKLSPKKWGLSGGAAIAVLIGIALYSYLVDSGVDLKPVAGLILALGFYDAIYLGGTGLMQVFSMWLPYQRRILVHEAGHVLVAYLLGCPIRGVILDPMKALKMGIQGQAGTQFWDKTLEMELAQNRLTGTTVDRYSIVLFAGIAAEAFIYGEAQGGESDENLFKSVVSQLQPSWSPAKMSNQARWAVVQAFLLVKENKKAHAAVVQALEQGDGLGSLIRAIEESMD